MTRLEKIADLVDKYPDGKMGHRIEKLKNMTDAEYQNEQEAVRAAAKRMATDLFKKLERN